MFKAKNEIIEQFSESGEVEVNKNKDAAVREQLKNYFSLWNKYDDYEYYRKAEELSQKCEQAKIFFELEFAKLFPRGILKNIKGSENIPKLFYAIYRTAVVAVAPTKKELIAQCKKNVPKLVDYVHITSL